MSSVMLMWDTMLSQYSHNMTFICKIFPCMTNKVVPLGFNTLGTRIDAQKCASILLPDVVLLKLVLRFIRRILTAVLAEASTESPMSITEYNIIYMCLSNMDSYFCYTLMSSVVQLR